jgi:light-independent protochlorophyllide reductase subunit L
MEASPELDAVQREYMRLAADLYLGNAEYSAVPMKDRDIFDLLGFD